MTNSNDRLTEVENDLETVKELMLVLARRAEATDARIDANTQAIAQLTQKINQLTEAQETTDAQVGVLVTAIDTLAVRVDRIVNYLENQSGDGRDAP